MMIEVRMVYMMVQRIQGLIEKEMMMVVVVMVQVVRSSCEMMSG